MKIKNIKTNELLKRLLFTLLVVFIYIIGRNITLTAINVKAYGIEAFDMQDILSSLIGSNKHQYSLFALGVTPSITVSIIAFIVFGILGKDFREHMSKIKYDNIILFSTLIYTCLMAIYQADQLFFANVGIDVLSLKKIDTFELILGGMIVFFLTKANTDYGIGGSMPIILFNIAETISKLYTNIDEKSLLTIIPLSIIIIAISLFMEYKSARVPVQRVSIHNDYAKDSYLEFKYNPVGTMPTMFAISFYAIPQVLVFLLLKAFPTNETLLYLDSVLNVNNQVGIIIYLCIIFLLTFLFAFVQLLPNDIADNLQKAGDSIVGVYAGKKTNKYLVWLIIRLCLLSGIVSVSIMGVSLFFSMKGKLSPELALFPSTLMILIGSLTNIVTELKAYIQFDSHRFNL